MARYRYPREANGTTKDQNGRILAGVTVSVFITGTTTPASIYTAYAGGTPVNSVVSDEYGSFVFYVDTNDYPASERFDITYTKTSSNQITFSTPMTVGVDIFSSIFESFIGVVYADLYGTSKNDTAIDLALADIGMTDKATLLFNPGTWTISANKDWSMYGNVTFKILTGVLFSHGAHTMAIPNPDAGIWQWLSGPGAVYFSGAFKEIYPEWFTDNVTPGTTDMTTALQYAVNAKTSYSTIRLTAQSYRTTAKLVYPRTATKLNIVSDCGSEIYCDHNDDGLDITTLSESYGHHKIQAIFRGPNYYYTNSSVSNGAGIRMHAGEAPGAETDMLTGWSNVFRDVEISGFKYAMLWQGSESCKVEGKSSFYHNQYGVYIDGGRTNGNEVNANIYENAIAGVYSSGRTGGSLSFSTSNIFRGVIQSNAPFSGASRGVIDSMGVYLKNSYDFYFDKIYIENQDYAVWLADNNGGHVFDSVRFAPGGAGLAKIGIKATTVYGVIFDKCLQTPVNNTDVHVEVITGHASDTVPAQFLNCQGFNFIPGSILSFIDVINNRPSQDGSIKDFSGALVMPRHGVGANAAEGTTPGQINGIGTATATLNWGGFGEISLANAISGATTITTFSNLIPGQIATLWNYQTAYPVTIKASSAIVTKGGDVTFKARGQMVVFYVNVSGNALEIGRNFEQEENVTATATTAINPFGTTYIDTNLGAMAGLTLADGTYGGQTKTITMIYDGGDATLTVAHHQTSNPEVFVFDTQWDSLVLLWDGHRWQTLLNNGVATP